jgi:hypothetical protein
MHPLYMHMFILFIQTVLTCTNPQQILPNVSRGLNKFTLVNVFLTRPSCYNCLFAIADFIIGGSADLTNTGTILHGDLGEIVSLDSLTSCDEHREKLKWSY